MVYYGRLPIATIIFASIQLPAHHFCAETTDVPLTSLKNHRLPAASFPFAHNG